VPVVALHYAAAGQRNTLLYKLNGKTTSKNGFLMVMFVFNGKHAGNPVFTTRSAEMERI
jgi:hypothetical protein